MDIKEVKEKNAYYGRIIKDAAESKLPLEKNKNEFKINASACIVDWELPLIKAMDTASFMKATELKAKFDQFKKEMIDSINSL